MIIIIRNKNDCTKQNKQGITVSTTLMVDEYGD